MIVLEKTTSRKIVVIDAVPAVLFPPGKWHLLRVDSARGLMLPRRILTREVNNGFW